jgi:hypothetical protein
LVSPVVHHLPPFFLNATVLCSKKEKIVKKNKKMGKSFSVWKKNSFKNLAFLGAQSLTEKKHFSD